MNFHTVIIGGGPAGLACAAVLAAKGIDTLLLERRQSIGPKVCAGGITWSGAAQYIPEDIIERRFRQQHIASGRQKTILRSDEPIVTTVNREKLGQWMAERAAKAGAVLRTGEQVTSIDENTIRTGTGSYGYRYLVGADGSGSLVRRYLGIPAARKGVGVQYTLPGSLPEMVWRLEPDLFASGYGWIFPHQETTSVGAYARRKDISPSQLKKGLHDWMDRQGIGRGDSDPEAALINFDYRGWQFGRRFLVGDAAGFASGITGEGIYSAILSGEAAARSIAEPGRPSADLVHLIKKHRIHTKMLEFIAHNRLTLKIMPELLILALRLRLLHYRTLELGSRRNARILQ